MRDKQDNLELFIRMRAQELYQEWSNDPGSTLTDIIAKGMMDAVRRVKPEGSLLIEGEVAQNISGLASTFVLEEEDLLTHLVSLGKLVASTTVYIKNRSGAFVALDEVE